MDNSVATVAEWLIGRVKKVVNASLEEAWSKEIMNHRAEQSGHIEKYNAASGECIETLSQKAPNALKKYQADMEQTNSWKKSISGYPFEFQGENTMRTKKKVFWPSNGWNFDGCCIRSRPHSSIFLL